MDRFLKASTSRSGKVLGPAARRWTAPLANDLSGNAAHQTIPSGLNHTVEARGRARDQDDREIVFTILQNLSATRSKYGQASGHVRISPRTAANGGVSGRARESRRKLDNSAHPSSRGENEGQSGAGLGLTSHAKVR